MSEKLITPMCSCQWAKVHEPDREYKKYSIDLLLEPETDSHKEFLAMLKEEAEKAKGSPPYKKAVDKDGNETGKYRVKFRSNYPPSVVDAENTPVPPSINIGNGSMVKVAYALKPYEVSGKKGITLYLNGVQVLDLVEFKGSSGFEVDTEAPYHAPKDDLFDESNQVKTVGEEKDDSDNLPF